MNKPHRGIAQILNDILKLIILNPNITKTKLMRLSNLNYRNLKRMLDILQVNNLIRGIENYSLTETGIDYIEISAISSHFYSPTIQTSPVCANRPSGSGKRPNVQAEAEVCRK